MPADASFDLRSAPRADAPASPVRPGVETIADAPVPEVRREPQKLAKPTVRRRSRRRLRYALFALGAIVLIVGGLHYWLSGARHVATDDAYMQANVLTVSTDVSGIVDQIPVQEGEHVTKGQVLLRLDPLKFQIALDNARANLAQTVLNLDSQADYAHAQRQVAAQQAMVREDQATYDR